MQAGSAQLWNMDQVADYLQMKPDTFRKKRVELQNEEGFPPPMPLGGAMRWSVTAIHLWELNAMNIADELHIDVDKGEEISRTLLDQRLSS